MFKFSVRLLAVVSVMVLGLSVASASYFVNPYPSVEGESWMLIEAAPGETVTHEFVLGNSGEFDADFELVVVDARFTEEKDGYFALRNPSDEQGTLGLWGELSITSLMIPAGETVIEEVTFTIPEDAPRGEDLWGGIYLWQTKIYDDSVAEDFDGVGVKVGSRVGLRIRISILDSDDFLGSNDAVDSADSDATTGSNMVVYVLIIAALVLLGGLTVMRGKLKKS